MLRVEQMGDDCNFQSAEGATVDKTTCWKEACVLQRQV